MRSVAGSSSFDGIDAHNLTARQAISSKDSANVGTGENEAGLRAQRVSVLATPSQSKADRCIQSNVWAENVKPL